MTMTHKDKARICDHLDDIQRILAGCTENETPEEKTARWAARDLLKRTEELVCGLTQEEKGWIDTCKGV
jgi:hypothetical protein